MASEPAREVMARMAKEFCAFEPDGGLLVMWDSKTQLAMQQWHLTSNAAWTPLEMSEAVSSMAAWAAQDIRTKGGGGIADRQIRPTKRIAFGGPRLVDNLVSIFSFMVFWPKPYRPFHFYAELLTDDIALPVSLRWYECDEYWSRGVTIGPLRFRVARDK